MTLGFQFVSHTSSPGGGVAFDWQGDAIAGNRATKRLDIFNDVAVPVESFGGGDFHGIPWAETTDSANDVFAYDGAGPVINSNPTAAGVILRFKPEIAPVRFTAVPPRKIAKPDAEFKYRTNKARITFECRLLRVGRKAPKYEPGCTGDSIVTFLKNGATYIFQARTISPEGGVSTPISYEFRVVLPVPHATITSRPPKSGTETTATFKFKSSIHGSKFKCRLFRPLSPIAVFVHCASPVTYKNLGLGSYEFQVEAISPLGVVQKTPTSYHFAVGIQHIIHP